MRSDSVVVVLPLGQDGTNLGERSKQGLVEQFVIGNDNSYDLFFVRRGGYMPPQS